MERELINWLDRYPIDAKGEKFSRRTEPNPRLAEFFKNVGAHNVIVKSLLVGEGREAALAADRAVTEAREQHSQDPCADDVIEKWMRSPGTGAATLLDRARVAAGWHPAVDGDDNVESFYHCVQLIDDCPLFHLVHSDVTHYEKRVDDWNKVITEIANLFEGVATGDMQRIVDGLISMVRTVTSRGSSRATRNECVIPILRPESTDTFFNLYRSHVDMQVREGKSTTRQVTYDVTRVSYQFRMDLWNNFATAKTICQRVNYVDIPHWLDITNTPPGDQPNTSGPFSGTGPDPDA